jgi:hypothetical protein
VANAGARLVAVLVSAGPVANAGARLVAVLVSAGSVVNAGARLVAVRVRGVGGECRRAAWWPS